MKFGSKVQFNSTNVCVKFQKNSPPPWISFDGGDENPPPVALFELNVCQMGSFERKFNKETFLSLGIFC